MSAKKCRWRDSNPKRLYQIMLCHNGFRFKPFHLFRSVPPCGFFVMIKIIITYRHKKDPAVTVAVKEVKTAA